MPVGTRGLRVTFARRIGELAEVLRGRAPALERPRTFVAWAGAIGSLAILGVGMLNGLSVAGVGYSGFAIHRHARFVREIATFIVCVAPVLALLGAGLALVYRRVGAVFIATLGRCGLGPALDVATRRSAGLAVAALPALGLLLAPLVVLWLEHRGLRSIAGLSRGRALFVQLTGRLITATVGALLCAAAIGAIYVIGEVGKHAMIGVFVCGVRGLIYGEVCQPEDFE